MFSGCWGGGRNVIVPTDGSDSENKPAWSPEREASIFFSSRPMISLDDLEQSNAQLLSGRQAGGIGAGSINRASAVSDKLFTGEELIKNGFKGYNAESLSRRSSKTLPLTFMVLDIIRPSNQRRRKSSDEGSSPRQPTSGSAKYRNRLVPIYTNSQCQTYFKISSCREYVDVLKRLLKRDPLLTFAVQKAVRHLKAGDPKDVSHVTPDPTGHSSSLIGVRITPCVWSQGGRTLPALMFEHKVAYDPAAVMPRLMRDYAVLSHVPAILTLIDFQVGGTITGCMILTHSRSEQSHAWEKSMRVVCVALPCMAGGGAWRLLLDPLMHAWL